MQAGPEQVAGLEARARFPGWPSPGITSHRPASAAQEAPRLRRREGQRRSTTLVHGWQQMPNSIEVRVDPIDLDARRRLLLQPNPGRRVPAAALRRLRRLRPRHTGCLQLQAARLLPLMRRLAHGAGGGPLDGPRISHVLVRQWDLSLPLPLRLLLASQPKLATPVLQVVHRVITRFVLEQAGVKAEEADSCAVTPIQRLGSAANLNIHLHCLVQVACSGAAPTVTLSSSMYLRKPMRRCRRCCTRSSHARCRCSADQNQ